ncbi:hypothetical protein QUF54_06115, partial [Candidatus Marithioploca araucensis]|nr:hypothetical protein [Candidatus Marithioploca araucensis]
MSSYFLLGGVHPETTLKIPKLKLWTPNNGHIGVQSFSFGSVSGWTLGGKTFDNASWKPVFSGHR